MKPSTRSKHYYKRALININNAYDRIRCLEESLNYQGFGDNFPETIVTNDAASYGISLWWNDTIYDMESVLEALDNNLQITPRILKDMLHNMETEK